MRSFDQNRANSPHQPARDPRLLAPSHRRTSRSRSPLLDVRDPAVISMDGDERLILNPAPTDDNGVNSQGRCASDGVLQKPPMGRHSAPDGDRGRTLISNYDRLSHSSTDPNIVQRSASQGLRTPSPSPRPPPAIMVSGNMAESSLQREVLHDSPRPSSAAPIRSRESVVRVTNEGAVQKREAEMERKARGASNNTSANSKICVSAAAALEDPLLGTRVSEGHENFVTAYNMLTGIRVAVSRCNAKLDRELVFADFSDSMEFSFDLAGDTSTPSTKYIFRFKDYSPWVFRHLRELFGLDPADYLMSLTAKYIVSELGSPGKSGSFFYYSRDYRFVIKTVHHAEHKQLRRILPDYYSHVRNYRNTLLSQFYGLHRVKLPFGRKIHFIVMNNVFPAVYEMHSRFDLKGSTLGRACRQQPGVPKSAVVQKDLDWLKARERIVLGAAKRKQLLKQLELDVRFLEKMNVMDYSLLIGIHDASKGNSALNALMKLQEFGPSSDNRKIEQVEHNYGNVSRRENQEFSKLQTLLRNSNPTALKNLEFNDNYRKNLLFYHDRGGFQSSDENNQPRDVIYYMGVIDFLTAYSYRKRFETFCKGLVHKRSELSAIPASEYGHRFYRFMSMSIGSSMGDNAKSYAEYDRFIANSPSATAFAHRQIEPEDSEKIKEEGKDQTTFNKTVLSQPGPISTQIPLAPVLTTPRSSPCQVRPRSSSNSSRHSVATARTLSCSDTNHKRVITSRPSPKTKPALGERASVASFGAVISTAV